MSAKEKKDKLAKAAEVTSENNVVLRAVWAGQEPKSALRYEEDGGKIKHPGGRIERAIAAHTKLFGKPPNIPGLPKQRGRPNGAVTRGNASYAPEARIKILASGNPKKAGSSAHERWKLYREGMTTAEFFKAGGLMADLKWDTGRGFIKVG